MANTLKSYILKNIAELSAIDPDTRIQQRIDKFSGMGFFEENAAIEAPKSSRKK
jgi:acetyl-CoA carboxylase carboxyl transferase subunit alpha